MGVRRQKTERVLTDGINWVLWRVAKAGYGTAFLNTIERNCGSDCHSSLGATTL
jgi:hypothetical protein